MDQDVDGADEAASTTLQTRVRMASSAPYKAPPPAQPILADADMDVISLVRPPSLPHSPFCFKLLLLAPPTRPRAEQSGV